MDVDQQVCRHSYVKPIGSNISCIDIVMGRSLSVYRLLNYLRDKFDLEYYYLRLIGDLSSDTDGISLEPLEDDYFEIELKNESFPEQLKGIVSEEDFNKAVEESETLSKPIVTEEPLPEDKISDIKDVDTESKSVKDSVKKQSKERKSLSPSKLRKKSDKSDKKEKKSKKKSRHSIGDKPKSTKSRKDSSDKKITFKDVIEESTQEVIQADEPVNNTDEPAILIVPKEVETKEGVSSHEVINETTPEATETPSPVIIPEAGNDGLPEPTVPESTEASSNQSTTAVPKRIRIHASKVSSGSFAKGQKIIRAQQIVRKHIINEICDTEVNYVKSLMTLKQSFLEPLKRQSVLSQETFNALFSNIEEILDLHIPFSEILQARVSEWNDASIVSDIFLQHTSFIRRYRSYLENYGKGFVTMYHVKKNNGNFVQMLNRFETELLKTAMHTLDSFLIMPVQRIPRYILLLKEMKKYTPEKTEEWTRLERAHNLIDQMLIELNAGIDQKASERLQKIISIVEKIQGETQLLNTDHTYINESPIWIRKCAIKDKQSITKEERKKLKGLKGYCFLFDKTIVLCEPIKSARNDDEKQYQLVQQYTLDSLKDVQLEKDIQETKIENHCGFKMKYTDKKARDIQFYLFFESHMLVVQTTEAFKTEEFVNNIRNLKSPQ